MKTPSPVAMLAAGALVVTALAQPGPSVAFSAPGRDASAAESMALGRLRADAAPAVLVNRDDSGAVEFLRAPAGQTLVSAPTAVEGRPVAAAAGYLRSYGAAIDVDGATSAVTDLSATDSATGGHVVRGTQEVDGLRVLGGDVVFSLDADGGLVSMAAATTDTAAAVAGTVSVQQARRTAVALTATARHLKPEHLSVVDQGQWLYDPDLLGISDDPLGARPVWRFDVVAAGVRELVLVDASRGGVALHVNQVAGLERKVCDRDNQATSTSVPQCSLSLVVRGETTGPTGNSEVDAAFTNIGKTSDFYQQVLGLDLGEAIGTGTTGARVLQSWVRWCTWGEPCPMDNAFWDGYHMVLGQGYAAADDVVAHELTHGVIDHTSQLFYLHQSGAIHESLADVVGELVDQRNPEPGEDDTDWLLGEDVPGGALRSLGDPTRFGQPDSMTSPLFGAGDAAVDSGEVHHNSGVGNQAAYLISQGGTRNGITVTGIDGDDPMLTKTATLYGQVLPRLTSGTEYADLGLTLVSTCQQLALDRTAGFTDTDCASVQDAVRATAMQQPPTVPGAAAAEAPDTCADGHVKTVLFSDDDGANNAWTRGPLWTARPEYDYGIPRYVHSGSWSWFGLDPDPAGFGDPSSGALWLTNGITVPTGQPTYLHFHHAYLLEWYPATATGPARYPDGATVHLFTPTDYGWGPDLTPLTWLNGPDKPVQISPTAGQWQGFGGDSHGWGSSRVDLTPLAGKTVRPQWRILGSQSTSFLGWYVDDIEVYTCHDPLPSQPRSVSATGTHNGAKLRWTQPDHTGDGITGYRVRRSDGLVRNLPADARSTSYTRLPTAATTRFTVTALTSGGGPGPAATATIRRTALSGAVPRHRVQKSSDVKLTARLTRLDGRTPVAAEPVQFQIRPLGGNTWTRVRTRSTRTDGTASARMTIRRSSHLRVRYPGGRGHVGSSSGGIKVTTY